MALTNFLFFALSLVFLIGSGSLLVRSGSRIARFLHAPEFVVGFILMAIGTSLPELFVGISSALNGNPSLSLGNVIGSNIANLSLIAGISVLIARKVTIRTKEAKLDSLVMVAVSILPLVLMLIGRELSRFDGVILLIAFAGYFYHVFSRRKDYPKEFDENHVTRKSGVIYTFLFIISLVALFFSAHFTVEYGSLLAFDLDFPPIFIGLFLLALGTSLPELVFGIGSMITGHSEMSVGNLIGSNIANATLILGVTALVMPIQADFILFLTSAIYMVVVSLIFTSFVESKKMTWIAGVSLIMVYVFFLIVEFTVKGL